ncbi:hypothetical protein HPB51_005979 [Rhipicephalus microplus]|uniref:Uncharacterized protein n=1 Tax=Rhipicephalus microplus TaxID=6941 RepID=A0A9J6DLE0_RHIMP|nr:hypothetical protein HPB51_005979 [Rhipicephalus microplus]
MRIAQKGTFAARMVSCSLFTNSAVVSSILASSRWKRFVECGDITLLCFLSCCLYRLAQRFYLDACETCARIISTLHASRRRHRTRIQGQGELLKLHSQYHGCVLDLSQRYFPAVPSYLSVRDQSTRETPDAKRSRQEASQLARAVEESLASYEAEQNETGFRPSKN